MLLRDAVVPTAVPRREEVRVLLEGSGELRARECLNIDEAILVRVSF
jgi:hypothetical protein